MSRLQPLSIAATLAVLLAAHVLAQAPNTPAANPTTAANPTMPPAATPTTPPAATPSRPARMPAETATTNPANEGASTTFMTADQQLRASKLIGTSVYDDQHKKIASID